MNILQSIKYVSVTEPGAIVDNAAFTTNEIDTVGWNKCTVYVQLGATDIALAEFKLQHSDTSGSGFVDISGADFSVSPATLPSATDDDKSYAIHVDLRGKKRYLDLSITAGDGATGTYASAFAMLSDGEICPDTAAERGIDGQELIA